jgi:hypothetical protein
MAKPKDLKFAIENIYETSPVLIIGEARLLFLRSWKYKVCNPCFKKWNLA